MYEFISLDLPALICATLGAVSCALLGNILVVRKLSLMGDAISHSVLPGIVAAFLITGSRNSIPVIFGAIVAGVVMALLVELVQRHGAVENSAAMGVVFVVLFAVGVLLIEQAAARSVDLDADCILHGQLESIFWHPPRDWQQAGAAELMRLLPAEIYVGLAVLAVCSLIFWGLYKELVITAFDPALADSLGISSQRMHYLMMVLVAVAVVVNFTSVGSILVIAMLICPAATARLLTDSFRKQIALSIAAAAAASVFGYLAAAFGPQMLGFDKSLSASGMITTVSGLLLTSAIIFAPRYGVLGKRLREFVFAVQVGREDLLAVLYRREETLQRESESEGLKDLERHNRAAKAFARWSALRRGEVVSGPDGDVTLTAGGRTAAETIVRRHRLWESYLVGEMGLRPDHVHAPATELEHVTTGELAEKLAEKQDFPATDPHGSPIPRGRTEIGRK